MESEAELEEQWLTAEAEGGQKTSWTAEEDKETDGLQRKPEPFQSEILQHSSSDLQQERTKS